MTAGRAQQRRDRYMTAPARETHHELEHIGRFGGERLLHGVSSSARLLLRLRLRARASGWPTCPARCMLQAMTTSTRLTPLGRLGGKRLVHGVSSSARLLLRLRARAGRHVPPATCSTRTTPTRLTPRGVQSI